VPPQTGKNYLGLSSSPLMCRDKNTDKTPQNTLMLGPLSRKGRDCKERAARLGTVYLFKQKVTSGSVSCATP